jgi:membrane protease YdiL (CAAX protease family)
MSGYVKGRRKPKGTAIRGITIAGRLIPAEILIASMLAFLYILFLAGSIIVQGIDSLMLKIFSFVFFALMAYLVRTSLKHLMPFSKLIDAFLVLSATPLAFEAASMFNILTIDDLDAAGLMYYKIIMSLASIALLVVLVFYEKVDLSNIFISGQNLMKSAIVGIIGCLVCVLLFFGLLYFIYGIPEDLSRAISPLMLLILFAIAGAMAEEAWFRGAILSWSIPAIEEKPALILQSIVFAVYEALIIYAIIPEIWIAAAAFVLMAVSGYYLGVLTLKHKNIAGPIIIHAGIYMIIGLPLFTGMLG